MRVGVHYDVRPSILHELEMFNPTLYSEALQNSRRSCPDALRVLAVPEYRPAEYARDPFWDESGLPAYDDSFMSWIPPHRISEQ
jgi:hypothetical protein